MKCPKCGAETDISALLDPCGTEIGIKKVCTKCEWTSTTLRPALHAYVKKVRAEKELEKAKQ